MAVTEQRHEVEERLALIYGRTPEQELGLDLYLPRTGEPARPGILFVHGGGWVNGQREQFRPHAAEAAALGYVAATISYRLAPAAPYPAALDDCQRAVRWLRRHADSLGLDPDRLGAFGSSAGAHLVACLGVRETRHEVAPELAGFSSRVNAVADIHGIHDFTVLETDYRARLCEPFLGTRLEDSPESWADASPISFVDESAAPMLVVHDPADATVPYQQSVSFATALMAAGRPVEFLPVPGAGHGFVYNPAGSWSQVVWDHALRWFARWLAPLGATASARS